MKKLSLVLMVFFIALTINAQKKKETPVNDCYIETAVSVLGLNENQKQTLVDAFYTRARKTGELNKKLKTGQLTKEQKASEQQVVNNEYVKILMNLTGKKRKELNAFDKETKKKCSSSK